MLQAGQKNFLQNWVVVQEAGTTDYILKETPMVQIPLGYCDKSDGVSKTCLGFCAACLSPPWTSHQCAAPIPGPPRVTLCGPIFSRMRAYFKEQGHCLSLHWEASSPCSSPGLHHTLQKQCPFSLPSDPHLLLTEPFHPSFPFITGA